MRAVKKTTERKRRKPAEPRTQDHQPRRAHPRLVGLRDDENAELEAGAAALGETPTETLRMGGLARARRAVLR